MSRRTQKQIFIREEIVEKGFDPQAFSESLGKEAEECSLDDLKQSIENFQGKNEPEVQYIISEGERMTTHEELDKLREE